jgi:hypothetical protein
MGEMGTAVALKAGLGRGKMRPPASPSCRLYLRAGSRWGNRGLRPGGKAEWGKGD